MDMEELYERLEQEDIEYINKVIENFDPVAREIYIHDKEKYVSVLIKDQNSDFKTWVDLSVVDNDISTDWNLYIFDLTNSLDIVLNILQANDTIYDYATSCALECAERYNIVQATNNGWKWIGKEGAKNAKQ